MAASVPSDLPPETDVVAKKTEQLFRAAKVEAREDHDISDISDISQSREALEELLLESASKKRFQVTLAKLKRSLGLAEKFVNALTSVIADPRLGVLIWTSLNLLLEHAYGSVEPLKQAAKWIKRAYGLPDLHICSDLFSADSVEIKACLMHTWENSIDFWIMAVGNLRRTGRRLWMTKEFQITEDMLQVMESIKHNNARLHEEVQLIIRRNTLKMCQPTPKTTLATLQSSEVQYHIIDIPYPRNTRSFCSRDDVFFLLHEALSRRPLQSDSTGSPVSCVLHGMGGVGKTEIALEYVYKYRHNYECVFWVSAQSRVHLSQAYCAIGKQVGVISATHQHSRDQCEIEVVTDWLKKTTKKWLMVFDNLEMWDEPTFPHYLPPSSQATSSIIFTSRTPAELIDWASLDVLIEPMCTVEGTKFLSWLLALKEHPKRSESYSSYSSEAVDVERIVSLFGGLPLGIVHASTQMTHLQISPQEYLNLLSQTGSNLLATPSSGKRGYERTLAQTFLPVIASLSRKALHLVSILACLDADRVLEIYLRQCSTCDCSDCFKSSDYQGFLETLAELNAHNLVRRYGTGEHACLSMHCVVKSMILSGSEISTEQKDNAISCTLKLLRNIVPRQPRLLQADRSNLATYLSHVLSFSGAHVLHHLSNARVDETVDLFCDTALDMYAHGLLLDSRKLLQTAERLLDGSGHPSQSHLRAKMHVTFALILDAIGISGRAEAEKRRNLALDFHLSQPFENPAREIADVDEILLYEATGCVAGDDQHIYELDEAREYLSSYYGQNKPWPDREGIQSFIQAMHCFGLSLISAYHNDGAAALRYAEQMMTLIEQAGATPDAAIVSTYRHYWAMCLAQNGQLDYALNMMQQLFHEIEEGFGMLSCNTLHCLLSIGILQFYANEHASAVDSLRTVLIRSGGVLTEETITRTQYYLSRALPCLDSARSAEAREIGETARQSMQRLMELGQTPFDNHFVGDEAVLYDFLVAPNLRLWMAHPDHMPKNTSLIRASRSHGTSSFSQSTTMNSALLERKVVQTASKLQVRLDATDEKETQRDCISNISVQADVLRGPRFNDNVERAVRSESWSSLSRSVVSAQSNDGKVQHGNVASTMRPPVKRAVERTMMTLDPVRELMEGTVNAAAQTGSAVVTQSQYRLALGFGVGGCVTGGLNLGVSGYNALSSKQSANAATESAAAATRSANAAERNAAAAERSAAAAERNASVAEANLQSQNQETTREKGKMKKQDDTDDTDDEGGAAPESSSKGLLDITRSNPLRRSPKFAVQSTKTLGYSNSRAVTSSHVNRTSHIPEFPSAPTGPLVTQSQSHSEESKSQNPQQQREASDKPSSTVKTTKTSNEQRIRNEQRRENQLAGKLQQLLNKSQSAYGSPAGSSENTSSSNGPSDAAQAIVMALSESEEKIVLHEAHLPTESANETVTDPPPVLHSSAEPLAEETTFTEMPAWNMKPEDLQLEHFTGEHLEEATQSTGPGQDKLLQRESDTKTRDASANMSSDEQLEREETHESI